MKGGRDGCAVNPVNEKMFQKRTRNPELCKLSAKKRCMKIK